jgi:hypothetical protein
MTDIGSTHLNAMINFSELDLSGPWITDVGIAELTQPSPRTDVFR